MTDSNNQRRFDRIRQRLPCVIRDGEAHHQGFVTDVLASGLFLQTLAGSAQLVIDIDWNGENITLIGKVARVRQSNRSATAVNSSGFGFRVESAPESYFRLIMDLQGKPD
jgi:hypothetical protein